MCFSPSGESFTSCAILGLRADIGHFLVYYVKHLHASYYVQYTKYISIGVETAGMEGTCTPQYWKQLKNYTALRPMQAEKNCTFQTVLRKAHQEGPG